MKNKITREKVLKAIPFSFGIIQNIADDLHVTRSAVSQFLSKPENLDLREILQHEEGRMWDYAKMNIARVLLSGDYETARWFLTHFPDGNYDALKKHKPRKISWKDEHLVNIERDAKKLRGRVYYPLLFEDRKKPGANSKMLPGRLTFPEPTDRFVVPLPLDE
ncbi:MAG: hypothetical protein K1X86_15320 [Ignavibacteria bacterium]|nr:hypothetical protein [Ignavibacteria bacterium]